MLVTTLLAQAGYVCGLSGKLHLSPADRRLTHGPEWWRLPREQWAVPRERRYDDGYAEFNWDHAEDALWPESDYVRWLTAQGARPTRTPRSESPYAMNGMPAELSQPAWCCDVAIDFIERHASGGRPWLFSVNCFDPHYPFDPPATSLDRYLPMLGEIPLPRLEPGEHDAKPATHRRKHQATGGAYPWRSMTPADHRIARAAYWAMCDNIDVQVGRLLAALERSGQAAQTLVIFTSDHGEMLGDHGIYTKGEFLYDEAIRVPLVMRLPNAIPGGRQVGGLVELVDLAPTLLELCGVPIPRTVQGRSLLPVASGQTNTHRDSIFCEYVDTDRLPAEVEHRQSCIRTATHKLVVHHAPQPDGELYDLLGDPGEHHNRWTDPAYDALKADLLARLTGRLDASYAPLPPRTGLF